jgi:hypothetical protein
VSAISIVSESLTIPGALAITEYVPGGTSAMVKVPDASVRARSGEASGPVTITSAFATVRPSGSVTRPLKSAVCAEATSEKMNRKTSRSEKVRGCGPRAAVMGPPRRLTRRFKRPEQ